MVGRRETVDFAARETVDFCETTRLLQKRVAQKRVADGVTARGELYLEESWLPVVRVAPVLRFVEVSENV